MDHPKDIGDRSALAIAIALQGIGHAVYLPFGENTRADFIIDDGTGSQGFSARLGGYAKASCNSRRAAATHITRTRDP
jgi:hypothetical protein